MKKFFRKHKGIFQTIIGLLIVLVFLFPILVQDKFGNLRQSSYPVSAGILFRELFRPVPGRGIFELF